MIRKILFAVMILWAVSSSTQVSYQMAGPYDITMMPRNIWTSNM